MLVDALIAVCFFTIVVETSLASEIPNCRNNRMKDYMCETFYFGMCEFRGFEWLKKDCPKACRVCKPIEARVRLNGGSNKRSGRVEINPTTKYREYGFGTICDAYWDLTNADVVCQELGFGAAIRTPERSRYTDQYINKQWLDRVTCFGAEHKLGYCDHEDWGKFKCINGRWGREASVECSQSKPFKTRMLKHGRVSWEGRLLVKNNRGQVGYVCNDNKFNKKAADVACRSLGYPGGSLEILKNFRSADDFWAFPSRRRFFPYFMKNLQCNGNETSLWDCKGDHDRNRDYINEYELNPDFCPGSAGVALLCDVFSSIDDKWEICRDTYCDCNEESKSVTCPNYLYEYALPRLDEMIPMNVDHIVFNKNNHQDSNFVISDVFYRLISKRSKSLKTLQINANSLLKGKKCVFNYNARTFLDLLNPKPSNVKQALLRKKNWAPPLLTMEGKEHCFIHPQDQDVCDSARCYSRCGMARYADAQEVTIRALKMKTQTIHSFYQNLANLHIFNVPSIQNIVLYAQTVYLNQEFEMPMKKFTIISRHFEMAKMADIRYNGKSLDSCMQGIYGNTQRYYLAITGAGNVRIEVWTETMKLDWKISNCQIVKQDIPPQQLSDDYAVASIVLCAKFLYRDDSMRKDLALAMVKYATSETILQIDNAKDSNALFPLVYSEAGEFVDLVAQTSSESQDIVRFVPWLSADLLSKVSTEWSKLLQMANKQYKGRITKNVAVTQVEEAKRRSKHELDAAQTQMDLKRETIKLARSEYEAVQGTLDEKKKAFEEGIEEYKRRLAAQRGIGIFKAILGMVGGALSGNPLEAVTSTLSGLADLADQLIEIVNMVDSIKSMQDDLEAILAAIESPSTVSKDEFQKKVQFIEKVAGLTVSVGKWETMVVTVNAKLAPASQISGATDYQVALNEVAIYGKMITLETIRQAQIIRKIMLLGLHYQSHANMEQTLRYDLKWEDGDQVKEWSRRQAFTQKFLATHIMETYCEAYFYSRFQECTPSQTVSPGHSLSKVSKTITKINIDRLLSVRGFCQTPQPFKERELYINDKIRLNEVKTKGTVQVLRKEMTALFKNEERVRLNRIEVWFDGIVARKKRHELLVKISQSGVFYDVFQLQKYGFIGEKPVTVFFRYRPRGKTITKEPEIAPKFKESFMNPTPFGDWTISAPKNEAKNSKMDFSRINRIRIKLAGSSVRCHPRRRIRPHE